MTTHALLQRLPLEALDATDEDGSAAPVVGVGQDVPDVGYRLGHRRLSPPAFRNGQAARPRGGQKRKRPGRPFGPPPGAFGSGF